MTVTGIHFPDNMVDYHRGAPAALMHPQAARHPHRKAMPSAPKVAISQYQPEHQLLQLQSQQHHYQQHHQHQHQQQHHPQLELQKEQSTQIYALRPSPNQSPPLTHLQQVKSSSSSHSRSRTSSSSIFPNSVTTPSPPQTANPSRRFSSQTTSTNSISSIQPTPTMQGTMQGTQPYQHIQRSGTNNSTSSSTAPRRSTSSRSSTLQAQTSYVALMRKQKATVWCDRSQTLDPRTAAAQKAAKHRAALEVHGAGNNSGRSSTLTSSGKVRSTKVVTYVPANLSGVSVPVRLSANEMLGDDDEEGYEGRSIGDFTATTKLHHRSGSGRSSVHSGKYPSGYPRSNQAGRFSTSSTPPLSGNDGGSPGTHDNIPELSETVRDDSYFTDAAAAITKTSTSISTGSEEDKFGELAELRNPPTQSAVAIAAAEHARKAADDLRRRGSVDERSMTMGGKVRLFVANPDLD